MKTTTTPAVNIKVTADYNPFFGQTLPVTSLIAMGVIATLPDGQTKRFSKNQFQFVDAKGAEVAYYILTLSSVGNPDYGQNPDAPMPGVPSAYIPVPSPQLASSLCRAYIKSYDLGAGNWSGGRITSEFKDKTLMQVSYNGRIWANDKSEIDSILTSWPTL